MCIYEDGFVISAEFMAWRKKKDICFYIYYFVDEYLYSVNRVDHGGTLVAIGFRFLTRPFIQVLKVDET